MLYIRQIKNSGVRLWSTYVNLRIPLESFLWLAWTCGSFLLCFCRASAASFTYGERRPATNFCFYTCVPRSKFDLGPPRFASMDFIFTPKVQRTSSSTFWIPQASVAKRKLFFFLFPLLCSFKSPANRVLQMIKPET